MISVCMASYNGENYIEEQINSILHQLGSNDELIISDDHSTDSTREVISKIDDKRIKLVLNRNKQGYTSNFENALMHAKGEYIFLSDQDDVWANNKVELYLRELDTCDFVMSDATYIDNNGNEILDSHFKSTGVSRGFLTNFLHTRYIGACMAFNKEVLNLALPFPKKYELCAHDYWITLVAEANFECKLINEKLLLYRRHDSNVTNPLTSNRTLLKKLHTRIYCIFKLGLRMLSQYVK